MVKLTVLYGLPADPAAFEDMETLQMSMSSEEGQAATGDINSEVG